MDREGQRRIVCSLALLAGLLGICVSGRAQEAAVKSGIGLRVGSRAEFGAELTRMGVVVEQCRKLASACDDKLVPADERVAEEAGQPEFQVRWEWLRAALRKASGVKQPKADEDDEADGPEKDRNWQLDRASDRLGEEGAEMAGARPGADDAEKRKVEEVLARREFGQVQETRWWQRLLAKAFGKIQDWWANTVGEVPWSPWIGVAFQWGLLGAAAVGLVVWAMRLSKQQRMSFATEREVLPAWQAESDDWAVRAKAEAAKGEWREAVHCLYWSAIVMLEGQKLWRQNRARTPREYVGLLEPGSARRRVLGGLTGVFERIWYGIRPATGEDYEKAARLLEELRVG